MLHFSMNVEETELDKINETRWNIPFEKVMFPEKMINDSDSLFYKKKARCNTLNDFGKVYLDYIANTFQISDKFASNSFYHLSLIDYDYRPQDFEDRKLSELLKNYLKAIIITYFRIHSSK